MSGLLLKSSLVESFVTPLLFVAMAMGVNHQQDENDQPADQQHENDWLILPNRLHKIGGIRIHSLSIYTRLRKNQIRGASGVVAFEFIFSSGVWRTS
ncbi:MAG: hypothetical protein WCS42_09670 [Verrucomicrobiota bacterium]